MNKVVIAIMLTIGSNIALGRVSYSEYSTATVYGIEWKYDGNAIVSVDKITSDDVYPPRWSPTRAFYQAAIPSSTAGSIVIPGTLSGITINSIGNSAFRGCSKLMRVTIPESITSIGGGVFYGCSALKTIVFKGDAPICGNEFYAYMTVYVKQSSTGWGVSIPGKWHGVDIAYLKVVKFNANGGNVSAVDINLVPGDAVGTLPTPTRMGYTFDGWYTAANGGAKISASTTVSADMTCYAHWTRNSYTIVYDANGGTGTTAPTVATYDQDATLAASEFTCYAKQFAGWATEPEGAVVYSAGQKVRNLTATANDTVTLYAVWEPLIVAAAEISAVDGMTFCGDSYTVILSCPLEDATIYYTTNGVTPRTSAAFAYTEPIVIYGSANIVAIAVKDGVKSEYTRVSIEQITPDAPVISPADGAEFRSETCKVTISCATDGAEIYYTLDGSEPNKESAIKYTAPFTIADTTTIKSVAVGGPLSSEVIVATLTKRSLTLAEAAGAVDLIFTTDAAAPWQPIVDGSALTGFAAQSGMIGTDSFSWMETTVCGKGTFAFRWRVECEEDDSGKATWDRFVVFTNGVEVSRIDGIKEWYGVMLKFADSGEHTVRWEFIKDDYDEEGAAFDDHGWVSSVTWTPDDPLPPLDVAATESNVSAIIAGLSDARLSDKIGSSAEYAAFRNWVDSSELSHTLVKDAPNAWLSYALDAPALMAKAAPLASEDIVIESIEPSSAATGAFDLVVDIADAEIGEGARIAEALGVEGAAELSESVFSSEGLSVTLERTTDGKARATVMPDGAPPAFFLRVTVK